MSVRKTLWNGESAVEISDGQMSVVTVPTRGGKIASITDTSGYEWLAQPSAELGVPLAYTDSFTATEVYGWDECAPTISACILPDNRALPDHGELWSQEWKEDGATLSTTGKSYDYEFRRSVTVDKSVIRLDYEVIAGPRDVPMLWAAHPLFRAPAGTTVGIADAPATVVDVLAAHPSTVPFSVGLRSIDTLPRNGERKIYLRRHDRARAAYLRLASGATLQMSWNPALVPHLGIYFDAGRHSAQNTIAIEPARGWFDSAERALKTGTLPIILAGTSQKWWIELRFAGRGNGASTK